MPIERSWHELANISWAQVASEKYHPLAYVLPMRVAVVLSFYLSCKLVLGAGKFQLAFSRWRRLMAHLCP